MYLPCWTDGLSFREQYDAYWIANEYEKSLQNEKEHSFYSLLPIRFFIDPYEGGYYHLSSCGRYRDGFELCRTSEIRHSGVEFAFQIWKTAAEFIRKEYPNIENCLFDRQLYNGVYPVRFAYSLEEIKNRQIEIMKELINKGFTVDEYLTVSYLPEGRRKTWHYQGIVGYSYEECCNIFYSTPYGELMPLTLRKKVSYSFEECQEYYRTFDEKILQLGNQVRAYQKNYNKNAGIFNAVKEKDVDKIKEYIEKGYSLNEIDIYGNSAFTNILNSLFDDEEKDEWDDIDPEKTELIDFFFNTGVNPAIHGVNSDGCSLERAVVYHRNKTAKWLLEKGVNPVFYPFIDDLCDEDVTLIDWLEESWHNEKTPADVVEMIQMLKQYS